MRVFITLCMVALAFGHPVKENGSGHVAISKDVKQIANEHVMHKRSIQADGEVVKREGHENAKENIIQKRDVKIDNPHAIKKRDAPNVDGNVQLDCSQISGENSQACGDQVAEGGHAIQKRDVQSAEDGHVIQKRDAQNVEGVAHQDDNKQVAHSNEGAVAEQSADGQYVYASDFGGPIVQIKQHVYKSNCCACGCDCDCEGEGGETTTTTAP